MDLKTKKEQSLNSDAVAQDPNLTRYTAMSYINFLNRNQRMIERGDSHDNFDEEEEENSQSEDDSADSASQSGLDESRRDKKGMTQGPAGRESLAAKGAATLQGPLVQNYEFKGGEFNKMLVAADGYGKEFLKSEVDRLIRLL